MVHLWVRAEQRPAEQRVGITPEGVAAFIAAGHAVTVEDSDARAIPIDAYRATGCAIAAAGDWQNAPDDAIIFGLKELDPDGPDLRHRHIMFGHAYKGQADGPALLRRFKNGDGTLYDLEYLTDPSGRRVAAFGYWAGYAGAAVGLKVWAAQQAADSPGPDRINVYQGRNALLSELEQDLKSALAEGAEKPDMIVIGALGRVGSGAVDLAQSLGLSVTKWDMAETAHGGPFPEILDHSLFVNCILANPQVPVFVPKSAVNAPRKLSVIADVSCDPSSDYNPIPIYEESSTFDAPLTRVSAGPPPLDVTAIDNLPSMLPVESSHDYAAQLLPSLLTLNSIDEGVWSGAKAMFDAHVAQV
ncbi:saccharopine dehydrogenase [Neptunicoccus cionae]|uniref:Saccharopine dehydrogenase [NAD(+), L-lysine-forming] n=1 Tax=Neptunicoccus cionae TaxID=2035344 RepID=A0A916QQZ8_9RHOB|nr:saccharopine dehydrogenase [Amylibacter cionae]GGA05050.1 saccharopine dehydrogenase [Amylibacter cionae]